MQEAVALALNMTAGRSRLDLATDTMLADSLPGNPRRSGFQTQPGSAASVPGYPLREDDFDA
jgi:hypothetical protein